MKVSATPPAVMPTTATPPAPKQDRVVIVGAGPAGMATAIELAQEGIQSVVLEKRGGPATRENLFAVSGPYADRLAALDPDGSLSRLLVPTKSATNEDGVTGKVARTDYTGGLQPDATRSRGDMDTLLRAASVPGSGAPDTRQWAKVPIGDLEEGLRNLARTRHKDLIELRQNADVAELRQGDDWAEAILAPDANGGAVDAVRGAMLVDASGRDLLGGPRTVYPEKSHWIGGRFAPPADRSETGNVRRRGLTPDGEDPLVTIKLPSADRTLVWAQVPGAAGEMTPEERAQIVERRATEMGVDGPLAVAGRTAPVSVQLWTSEKPAEGRVLKVGDSVRAPYFPTSTGAAAALVHDAPRAVDAIKAALSGTPVEQATAAYADAVRGANEQLLKLSRSAMLRDLGMDPKDAGAPTLTEQAPAGSQASPQLA